MNTQPTGSLPRLAAALLNLTGLSLGYFYLRAFVRGGICLGITLALVLFGFFTPGLHLAALVVIVLALWLVLMAVDGWRQAGKNAPTLPVPAIAGLLAALVLLGGEIFGASAYTDAGQKTYETGEQLYGQSDYVHSRELLQSFTNSYHLTLNPHIPDAEGRIQECDMLTAAADAYTAKEYSTAVDGYEAYLAGYPESSKQTETRVAAAQAYLDWAGDLQSQGSYADALERYETIINTYPDAPCRAQAHQSMGESHVQWAAQLYADKKQADALAQYEIVLADFADTPSLTPATAGAAKIRLEMAQAFHTAEQYEQAVEQFTILLNDFADLPEAVSAQKGIAQAYLDWGNALFEEKQYAAGLEKFEIILKDYKKELPFKAAGERAAEIHLILGKALMEEKNFEQAVIELETVLKTFAATPSQAEAFEKAAEAHYAWGDQLAAAGKFELALSQYDLIINQFSESPLATTALSTSGTVRMEVAALYRTEGKYQEAVNLYTQIIAKYVDQPETAAAGEELPGVYLDWARNLLEDKLYEQALAKLDLITQNYAKTAAAGEVASVTVDINVAWGQDLVSRKQYIQAIEKLGEIKKTVGNPQLQKIVTEAYDAAVQALAKDTGIQGQQVVSETISRACEYKVAASPAVGILSGKVHAVVCGNSGLWLDSKYAPKNPGNFYYAVFVKSGTTQIESCAYTGGHTLIRQQPWTEVSIRSVRTMGVVASKTYTGGMPEQCNRTEMFYGSTKYKVGTNPNTTTMLSWVVSFLNP